MSNFNSDFVKRTSDAISRNNYIPRFDTAGGEKEEFALDNDDMFFEEKEPVKPAKVVLISGKYDDKYLPKDDLSVFRKISKVPALLVLFIAGLGVLVMIMVFIALS